MQVAREEILQLVRVLLGQPSVKESDRLIEDLSAESADLVNLVATVEETYQVHVPEAAIAEMRTVGDLHALVERLG
jgi:acyl carrier protein